MQPGISAIVIAYNPRELLSRCLSSLSGWVDELIVVDLESEENLASTAKKFHAVYQKLPHVEIVEQIRQKCLSLAHHEYVLFLDPDEVVPPQLATLLQAQVKSNSYDYFSIPRKNLVFGTWLRHSRWWPDYQVRLFRHGQVKWPTVLHLQPEFSGRQYTVLEDENLALVHTNYKDLDEWFDKNRRYAKQDARDRLASGENFSLAIALRLSVSELVSRFFQSQGYRDGLHGLILSILQSFYYFLVYAYYWEMKGYSKLETAETIYSFPRDWFRHGLSEIIFWDTSSASPLKKIHSKLVRKMIA